MFQTLVALLLAADFLKTDIKCNTTDAIYPRSMTNAEYIAGKFLGVFSLFFLFDVFVMVITFIINSVFVAEASVAYSAYFLYFLIIILPTLVFTIGISMFIMALIKEQSITFLLLFSYTIIAVFYFRNKVSSIFNITAHHIIEIYSDFVGFGNIKLILMHRGVYFLLGLGFVFFAVILFKRLPQSKFANTLSLVLACLLTCGSIVFCGAYINHFSAGTSLRQQIAALNNHIGNEEHITVTDCNLELIHDGDAIDVAAKVTVINNSSKSLDTYYFSLNPGLSIQEIINGGEHVPFTRNLHIVTIEPHHALSPGSSDTLVIRYRGTIDEDACYVDIDEERRILPYGYSFYNIAKRYSFVRSDYVMLTPETLWYPVTGVPFGAIYPRSQKKDFVNFELAVTTKEHLTALSQGEMQKKDQGMYIFKPENPLPQISLVIGEYETLSTVVDSIEYSVFVKPGHDYFSHLFTELRDENLTKWIREQKNGFESSFGGTYPYPRLSLIEVPIQFYAFNRAWSGESQTVQPEMVFLPEKGYGFYGSNFESDIERYKISHSDRWTLQDMQEYVLETFISYLIHGINYYDEPYQNREDYYHSFLIGDRAPWQSYSMFSQYTHFLFHVVSDEYPFITSMIENYIMYKSRGPNYSINRLASLHLKDISLHDNLNDLSQKTLARQLLKAKSDEYFAILEAKIGERELTETIHEFIESNVYSSGSPYELFEAMQHKYAIDLNDDLREWYARKGLPGYVVTDGVYYEIIHNERTYHQARFTIHNLEPVDSYLLMQCKDYDSAIDDWINYQVSLKGNQSKEIGIIFDSQPTLIEIHTLLSQNIPNRMRVGLKKENTDEETPIFDGERIVGEQFVYEKPGEIIVDNEDAGFQIIEEKPRWQFLQSLIQPEETTVEFPRTFFGYTFETFDTWSYYSNESFFGLYAKTTYIISGGNGQNKVRWTAELPEEGEYDLYYYSFYYDLGIFPSSWELEKKHPQFKDATAVDDYNFLIYHDNGIEKIKRKISDYYHEYDNPVEVHLGTYYFSKGAAKIELTDETDGLYIFADAVKWVKR